MKKLKFEELKGFENLRKAIELGKKFSTNPIIWVKSKNEYKNEYFAINETETYIFGKNGEAEFTKEIKDSIFYTDYWHTLRR